MLMGYSRLPGDGIPNAILGTAFIKIGVVPGHKYHDMGAHPWLPWCLHIVRGAGHCSDTAGRI